MFSCNKELPYKYAVAGFYTQFCMANKLNIPSRLFFAKTILLVGCVHTQTHTNKNTSDIYVEIHVPNGAGTRVSTKHTVHYTPTLMIQNAHQKFYVFRDGVCDFLVCVTNSGPYLHKP